jgi:hypothetical protein
MLERLAVDPGGVDDGPQAQAAGLPRRDGDFLANQGRIAAAGEGDDLDLGALALGVEPKTARQLAGRKVVGLLKVEDLVRRVRKPDAVDG